jgi:hypothetical protein
MSVDVIRRLAPHYVLPDVHEAEHKILGRTSGRSGSLPTPTTISAIPDIRL